ncbi:thiolase [Sphingomonas sp. AOB5]|uniref:thiolase n=1 Tax=Sphingomonas sp. AOB5 TaxID=3034017 RepID=UPI0023F83830|nr:thiolase [Sphingomonas sp. AOB5]MDF7774817.1 thiolase [Sphingomonas sp. AOB5]
MSVLRGKTAVVGVGTAGIGYAPGFNSLELMAQASHEALADCGLTMADVDGLFVSSVTNAMPTVSAAEYFGIHPRHAAGTFIGGSAFVAGALDAMLALEAGLCDVALIAYGSNQRSAGGKLQVISEQQPYEKDYLPQYPLSSYALTAARHMHEYGTTREQMAAVAVAARQWAQLNPDAFRRDPLTIEDVVSAPIMAPPLGTKDCCLVTDGAAAVVMVRADRAKDMPRKPVYLLGAAAAYSHRQIAQAASLTRTAAADSGPRALAMAGLGVGDVDVVQLYDAFTINTILFLEDLGFCPKGEGGRFVENGRIAPGGALPVNTNGGGLSCVHPGMYGLFLIVEAVEQLRGQLGDRQVKGAETALIHGNGGVFSTQVTALLGTEATL